MAINGYLIAINGNLIIIHHNSAGSREADKKGGGMCGGNGLGLPLGQKGESEGEPPRRTQY